MVESDKITIFAKNSGGDRRPLLVFDKPLFQFQSEAQHLDDYKKHRTNYHQIMINKTEIEKFIESKLADTSYFLVNVKVSKDNEIKVEIDSMQSVDIDFCITLSKEIEKAFPRDNEDYELEVGSSGITSPFKVHKQFVKNIGKDVEVLTRGGKKHTGLLLEAGENEFKIRTLVKFKPEGKKRDEEREEEMTFSYDEVNSVKYLLKF